MISLLRTFTTLCIFRNGRWRSEWTATFSPGGSGEINGVVRAQVCINKEVWLIIMYDLSHEDCGCGIDTITVVSI